MILLVGPPGSGKSTFCHQAVLHSLTENRPVIFVTTENTPSDVIRFLQEKGLSEIPSATLSFVDAFHQTVGLSDTGGADTISCSCGDLTSIEVAISKLRNKIDRSDILLDFDSLTSPYLLNGHEIVRFLRLSIAKFAAEGNSVLMCIDEGCGKPEDIGAMMSISNGVIKMKVEEGSRTINVVKHPLVKPTIVQVPIDGLTPVPPSLSLESLNEKLDWIVRRLSFMETILTESQRYPEVVSFLRSLRLGTALYGEPLKTLDRLVSVSHVVESTAKQDEVSRIILNALALKGGQNISQLTREVEHQRGKGSRITVRKRVKKLVESKVLVKEGDHYRLTQ